MISIVNTECHVPKTFSDLAKIAAWGRLGLFGWLGEVERDLTIERTTAGLDAAKRRGVKLGRKRKLSATDVTHARRVIAAGEETVTGMARILKVSRNTLGRSLRLS